MRIKKIYFNRRYNQWRDEPIFVEDEIYDEGLCVHMVDVKFERGSINTIIADFKDSNGATYSVEGVADYNKKTATFKIPPQILSNDGVYEVVFSISYNGKSKFVRTAIQTFTIRDTIEINDEVIQQETNYPVLVDLINNMANYKVDTSNFPTREEMIEAIEENTINNSIDEILKTLEIKGYITRENLNRILTNYATKASLSSYATQSDLNKFVTNLKFIQELDRYQLKTSMSNYVLKENGKGLSTHDLTDELYNKLVNLGMNNIDINLSEYALKIELPKNISELTNDSGFVTIDDIHNNIPTKTSQLINDNDFITSNDIPEVPTKISQLTNDNGFITIDDIPSIDLTGYATEDFVTNKIAEAQLNNQEVDLSKYAKITDIPINISQLNNDSDYINKQYVDDKIGNKKVDEILGHYELCLKTASGALLVVDDSYFKDSNTQIAISSLPDGFANIGEYVRYIEGVKAQDSTGIYKYIDDISNEIHTHNNKEVLDIITSEMIDSWNSAIQTIENTEADVSSVSDDLSDMDNRITYLEEKELKISAFDGSYNSLTGKPTIPSKTSQLKNDSSFVTETFVTNKIAEASLNGGEVDLSGLATKDELNTKVDKVDGKSLVLDTEIAKIHSHDNKTVLDNVTQAKITEWNNKSDFSGSYNDLINKPTIPSKISQLTNDSNFISSIPSEYVTESELNAKGYLTEHQDISDKVDKVDGKGLSTNDLTNNLKSNYDTAYTHSQQAHAPSNAEQNVQSDWNITDNTSDAYIKNKPTIPSKVSDLTNDSGFITSIPSEYITETELNEKGYSTFSGSYNDLTDKPIIPSEYNLPIANQNTLGGIKVGVGLSITAEGVLSATGGGVADSVVWENIVGRPTNVSVFNNDAGYLTEHQDISNLALKSELHNHTNKTVLDNITSDKVTSWDNKSDFSGSYNDLTDKPTIPSEYTLPTASTDTLGGIKVGAGLSINEGVLSVNGGGTADSVDWINVQNKPTIPRKTSDLTNDSGFITSIPSEYITETELEAKGYLTEHQSLDGYAKTTDLHSHTNKTVLDNITDIKVSNWNTAYTHSQTSHFSGSYNDLTDKPTIPTAYTHPTTHPASMITGLSTVATSGSYNDLSNKPTIPTKVSDLTNDSNFISSIPSEYITKTELEAKGYSTFSGNYNDLTNKPTIPSEYTHPSTHPASMITGLATVSTSGSYNDLSNKPTIPTKTSQLTNDSGYITSSSIPTSLPANGGNADTVNNFRLWKGTQAEYDAITTKDANTIYMITG